MKELIKKNKVFYWHIANFTICLFAFIATLLAGLAVKENADAKSLILFCSGMFAAFAYLYIWNTVEWFIKKYLKKVDE